MSESKTCEDEGMYAEVMFNASYGGFQFRNEAHRLYCEDKGIPSQSVNFYEMARTDPLMIKIVKKKQGQFLFFKDMYQKDRYKIQESQGQF